MIRKVYTTGGVMKVKIKRILSDIFFGGMFEPTKIPKINSFSRARHQIDKAWTVSSRQFITQWIERNSPNDNQRSSK
jgi:hypothetical protein